jgi:hypothetical protein
VIREESTRACIVAEILVRWEISLMENWPIASLTPFRIALRTMLWICSWRPISVKIDGASAGLICQRSPASTVIPICSLDRAAISSTWSPGLGILLLAGGVDLHVGPRLDEPDAGEQWGLGHGSEGVLHADFTGIDHPDHRADEDDGGQHHEAVRHHPQDIARRPRLPGIGLEPGGGGHHQEGCDQQYDAHHETAHRNLGFGGGRQYTGATGPATSNGVL